MDFDEGQMRQETVPPNVRVMERTLAHLEEHYGGIMGYLHHIGINADEASHVCVTDCPFMGRNTPAVLGPLAQVSQRRSGLGSESD